ncbi:MAG: hypothetical protein IIV92_04685 [Schwartzia sp.]|nr:hypothetical protein [Schwartzia sp. (in: firmicutes)]
MKKLLMMLMMSVFLLTMTVTAEAGDNMASEGRPKVAVIMDTPLVFGDDDKIKEAIVTKVQEWFPSNKYEILDFDTVQTLVTEYREENDMVVYEENTQTYKPLKVTDIEQVLGELNPDLVLNMRCTSGRGKTVMTAFSIRTKVNVTTNIRVLDMKTKKYIQRYEKTEAVGSGDMWGNSSSSRSYRKGLLKGIEGFKPDHNLY